MDEEDLIPRDTGKLWGEVRDLRGQVNTSRAELMGELKNLQQLVVGYNGDNGLKGQVMLLIARINEVDGHVAHLAKEEIRIEGALNLGHNVLEGKIRDVDAYVHQIWEKERFMPGVCIGKKGVDDLRDEIKAEEAQRMLLVTQDRREAKRLMFAMLGSILTSLIAAATAIGVAFLKH